MEINNRNSLLVPSSGNKPVISFYIWNNSRDSHSADEDSSFRSKKFYTDEQDSPENDYINNSSNNNLVRVLHVEDDQQQRLITKFLLSNICEVDSATNPEETHYKVRKKNYDLIMMDLDLGHGLDGLELTRKIRSIPSYKHTPILALTANNDPIVKAKCRVAGINAYIEKPFLKSDIISTIENLTKHNY